MHQQALVELTADIVVSQVANNSIAASDVPALVKIVHKALSSLGTPAAAIEAKKVPAVSVRSSVKADTLTCLACGKTQQTLRRHLAAAHGMTPEQYRAAYELPASYPMTAPNYVQMRRELALAAGLGKTIVRSAGGKAKRKAASPRKT